MIMKKTNKFILGAALTSGVIACFGTAFAAYKNLGNDIEIGIGSVKGHTDSSDTVTYKIGTPTTYKNAVADENVVDLSTTKLSPELNKLYIKVPLSFEYAATAEASVSAQDSAVGHLNVKVDIAKDIAAKGTTVTANLTGYKKDGDNDTYFTTAKMNNFFSADDYKDKASTATDGFVSQSGYIDTAIDATNISCVIGIDMSSALTDTNKQFLDLANIDKAFKVTVNWSPYENDETEYASGEKWTDNKIKPTAFVRGDRSDWQLMEDYRMVPNINASKTKTVNDATEYLVEWKYTVLKDFTKIKVYDSQEETYGNNGWVSCRGGHYADKSDVKIEDGGNAILESTDSYNVYYTRNAASDQGFWVDSTSYTY